MGKDDIALADIDKQFCKYFVIFLNRVYTIKGRKYLGRVLCVCFANVLSATLNMAVSEDAIHHNPYQLLDKSERPKRKQEEREFLTIEELKKLMKTPLHYNIVKKAFLFACFTALRYRDAKSLKWSEIHFTADGKGQYIDKTQVKTRKNVIVPLRAEAIRW